MAETRTARTGTAWFGWVTFAAVLLVVIGLLNILEGLVALLQDQVAFIDGDSLVVVDLTGLGVVMLVFGALLLAAGIGLFARNSAARIAAIVVVAVHAIAQIGSLGAYPVWSLLMITLDVIILFALTVHWSDATAPLEAAGTHRMMTDRDLQQPRGTGFPMNAPPSSQRTPAHAAQDVAAGSPGTHGSPTGDPGSPSGAHGSPGGVSGTGQQPAHAAPEPANPYQPPAGYQSQQPPMGQPPNAGPYPPNRPSSPAHAAPTSGYGTGAGTGTGTGTG